MKILKKGITFRCQPAFDNHHRCIFPDVYRRDDF